MQGVEHSRVSVYDGSLIREGDWLFGIKMRQGGGERAVAIEGGPYAMVG